MRDPEATNRKRILRLRRSPRRELHRWRQRRLEMRGRLLTSIESTPRSCRHQRCLKRRPTREVSARRSKRSRFLESPRRRRTGNRSTRPGLPEGVIGSGSGPRSLRAGLRSSRRHRCCSRLAVGGCQGAVARVRAVADAGSELRQLHVFRLCQRCCGAMCGYSPLRAAHRRHAPKIEQHVWTIEFARAGEPGRSSRFRLSDPRLKRGHSPFLSSPIHAPDPRVDPDRASRRTPGGLSTCFEMPQRMQCRRTRRDHRSRRAGGHGHGRRSRDVPVAGHRRQRHEVKDHTTLVAAVKAAGLVETLKGAGPFTVFAPTNAAFEKLPAGTVDMLLSRITRTS